MQAIDNLRKILPWCCDDHDSTVCIKYASCQEHIADMLDAIEREIAERYVELPKDADGEPIHIGDVMEWVDIEGTVEVTCTVEAVGVGCFFAWDKANGRYAQKLATSYRHHKPDTWEQIIEDALDGYHDTDFDALVARCKALAGDAE